MLKPPTRVDCLQNEPFRNLTVTAVAAEWPSCRGFQSVKAGLQLAVGRSIAGDVLHPAWGLPGGSTQKKAVLEDFGKWGFSRESQGSPKHPRIDGFWPEVGGYPLLI